MTSPANVQFTPGPWEAGEADTRTPIKGGGKTVAYVHIGPERDANSKLIVAAPAMFAALKFFRDLYGDPNTWPDDDREALEMADAALALARGEAA